MQSFPNGSACGPDGLRLQHLKELTGISAMGGGKELLRALTAFLTFKERSHSPSNLHFHCHTDCPAEERGGIWLIAVGLTLRRLVVKCASFHVCRSMGAMIVPLQLGFGTPLGCEVAVHTACLYLSNSHPDHILLMLDFSNAFNCLSQDRVLKAVKDSVPELYSSTYGNLSCRERLLHSAKGVQQGNPLDPLLFCFNIYSQVSLNSGVLSG